MIKKEFCQKNVKSIILAKFRKFEINRKVCSFKNLTINILKSGNNQTLYQINYRNMATAKSIP